MNKFEPIFFTQPSGSMKRRTLHKGGGGGDGGAADRKAAEDNRVNAAIQQINSIFGKSEAAKPLSFNGLDMAGALFSGPTGLQKYVESLSSEQTAAAASPSAAQARENLYSKIGTDSTNAALVDLNKERGIAERDLNFSLARAGLSGGSREVDASKDILDVSNQGVLKASNMGLATANDARAADDRTRVNLINSVRSGLDQGSALQQSYEGMANNARTAQDNANNSNLAGFFDVIKQQQQQAAFTNGMNNVMGVNATNSKTNNPYSSSITQSYQGS